MNLTRSSARLFIPDGKPVTDAQMMAVRRTEQNNAAIVGQYGVMIQMDHPSGAVKSATDPSLKNDLKEILSAT